MLPMQSPLSTLPGQDDRGPAFLSARRHGAAVPGMHHVLLVGDNAAALPALVDALAAEGLRVDAVLGSPAGWAAAHDRFDAVLMWISGSLAGQLGRLRDWHRAALGRPLLVACPGLRELEQVLALEMGADDVLDAAWSAPVVAARLRARWRAADARLAGEDRPEELRFGGLHLVRHERRVDHHGVAVPLTEGEFEVLWLLASHAGQALTRSEMLRRVRGLDDQPMDRSIDCRVYRIRAKLGDHDRPRHRIRTVRNRGYVFLPIDW